MFVDDLPDLIYLRSSDQLSCEGLGRDISYGAHPRKSRTFSAAATCRARSHAVAISGAVASATIFGAPDTRTSLSGTPSAAVSSSALGAAESEFSTRAAPGDTGGSLGGFGRRGARRALRRGSPGSSAARHGQARSLRLDRHEEAPAAAVSEGEGLASRPMCSTRSRPRRAGRRTNRVARET
jgi:hypothetical protein